MNTGRHIGILLMLTLLAFQAMGQQQKIRVLNADRNTYNPRKHPARILRGNVKIEHKGALLYCDTALYYDTANMAQAFGHVQINQADTLNVYGDTIFYEGDTRVATVFGNVKMVDDNAILRSPRLVYRMDSSIAYYDMGGFMYDSKTGDTLISEIGTYYANRHEVEFLGDVYYKSEDYTIESDTLLYHTKTGMVRFRGPTKIITEENTIYCESGWYDTQNDLSSFSGNSRIINGSREVSGDSIYYDRIVGNGEIFGNMEILDTAENFRVLGNYGVYNEKSGNYMVTDNPLFEKMNDEDTLYLKADTLFAVIDTTNKSNQIQAYNNVRFIQDEMIGKCDSLFYSEADSLIEMYYNPIIWKDSNQLTGDTVLIRTYDGHVDSMKLRNKAFIISEVDSLMYNQIAGKNMLGLFKDNELERVYVTSNGQTVYYAERDEEDGGGFIGMDRTVCSDIKILLREEEIYQIIFITEPEQIMYPMDQIPDDKRLLRGFFFDRENKQLIMDEFELVQTAERDEADEVSIGE